MSTSPLDEPVRDPVDESQPGPLEDEYAVTDPNAETLIDERRGMSHPEPFGRPGRPIMGTPFQIGFAGAFGVFAAYAVVQMVLSARSVLVLVAVSMFLAIGLNPTVDRLVHHGMSRRWAVTVVVGTVVLVFAGFVAALVPIAIEQGQALVRNAPRVIDDLQRSPTIRRVDEQYHILERVQAAIESGDAGQRVFGGIVGVGRLVIGAVFSTLTVLVLTLYFLASLPAIKRQAYRLAPASRRERVSLLGDEILARIGGYVSGQVTVAVIAGLVTMAFLVALSVPYAFILAIIAAIGSLVPLVGATAAAVIYCTVAFVDSPTKGVLAVVCAVVYQQVENYLIYPRVMRSTVDVPSVLTLTAALIGGALLGVVGALLAIPTAAALLLLVREVVVPRQDRQ